MINKLLYMTLSKRLQPLFSEAEMFLRENMDSHTYVSFSAGKDSSVIAHLAHLVKPGIPILMVDPGCPTHWTEDERKIWIEYAKCHGWKLKIFPWNKWEKERSAEKLASLHHDQFEALTAYARANGLVKRVIGLREAESKARKITSRYRGRIATYKNGEERLLPITKWRTEQVWAYIVSRGLPWLSIYDHLGPEARNGLIGVNGAERGRMVFLKKYYPKAYEEAKTFMGKECMNYA